MAMMEADIFSDEKEYRQHRSSMERVAGDLNVPFDMVERVYGIVLCRYVRTAHVKDFLPILVSKKVRYLLRKRGFGLMAL
ncbi:MAG: DUF3562 domain-containing protein [Nitrospirales bacterium]|nr:DUF3562 domain-containing protein [Nitrospirales bacterium]